MYKHQIAKTAKLIMLATTLSLSAFSLNAQAKLTSITTSDGTKLVYSSVSDVTWTKDANLLGTWLASSTDADGNGTKDIIDAIIQATYDSIPGYLLPILKPQIDQYVNAAAFNDLGTATWYGANAFVTYLNSINYGGSNQWYLPTVANPKFGFDTATNGTAKGDELVELFYQELNGTAGSAIPNTPTFDYDPDRSPYFFVYWSGTDYAPDRASAWGFRTSYGLLADSPKRIHFYAWAVTPGQIAAVPEPDSVGLLLFGSGLLGVMGLRRRKQAD